MCGVNQHCLWGSQSELWCSLNVFLREGVRTDHVLDDWCGPWYWSLPSAVDDVKALTLWQWSSYDFWSCFYFPSQFFCFLVPSGLPEHINNSSCKDALCGSRVETDQGSCRRSICFKKSQKVKPLLPLFNSTTGVKSLREGLLNTWQSAILSLKRITVVIN